MFKYLFFFLFLLSFKSWANSILDNSVNFNQNPSQLIWKKIDTDHFEIIFPEDISREAKRVAYLLEKVYNIVSRSLETYPQKISLILQNQSTQSNGFVTLAPRRSEWFITPSVDPELTNTEWLKTLALHEFRHVVQFQKTRKEFNKYFEFFLGEIGQALGLAFTLPPWFLEGDAVGIETALSQGGRGRLPVFERDLRTLLIAGKKFNFDKANLRSLKDWVPNHYVYGYFLTSELRNKYGDLALSKMADISSRKSWNPLSFYNTADNFVTGDFEKFYADTMKALLQQWMEEYKKVRHTPVNVLTLNKPFGWTNYTSPMVTSDGDIIALKSGLSFINHFVLIKNNSEQVLFYPGPMSQSYPLKLRNDRFAFLDNEFDPRWGYRDFQKLKVYDFRKNKIVFELPQTKLRLAVLNAKGSKVLAVEWEQNQDQQVVVIDLKTSEKKIIPFPDDKIITSIDWLNDDNFLAVIKDFDDLKSIVEIAIDDGTYAFVTPPQATNLGFLTVSEQKVLVESPESGIDNIFHLENGKLEQITISKFGAYSPVLYRGQLYFSDYTVEGLNIVYKSLDWNEKQKSQNQFRPVFEKLSHFERGPLNLNQPLREKDYEIKAYSQTENAFNFHSWILLIPPLANTISLTHFSQDLLNKFQFSYGGEYNLNERVSSGFVSTAWTYYYPVFDLNASYGSRRQTEKLLGKMIEDKWEEGILGFGISIPQKSIINQFSQKIVLRLFSNLIHVTNKYFVPLSELSSTDLLSNGISYDFSLLQRTASRDIYSPLGLSMNFSCEEGRNINGEETRGSLCHSSMIGYLPGVSKHHSFFQEFAYERQLDNHYRYSSKILSPRGTSHIFFNDLFKYSANYTLPLTYPDWNLSRYYYLKQIYANFFYDRISGSSPDYDQTVSSAGAEMVFTSNFFRLMLPINLGIRGSYLLTGPTKKSVVYDFFLTSNLAVF